MGYVGVRDRYIRQLAHGFALAPCWHIRCTSYRFWVISLVPQAFQPVQSGYDDKYRSGNYSSSIGKNWIPTNTFLGRTPVGILPHCHSFRRLARDMTSPATSDRHLSKFEKWPKMPPPSTLIQILLARRFACPTKWWASCFAQHHLYLKRVFNKWQSEL